MEEFLKQILAVFHAEGGMETLLDQVYRFFASVLVILIILGARRLTIRIVTSKTQDETAAKAWRRGIRYVFFFLMIFILFPIWLPSIRGILAILGIFGAGVVIVLKEVILNIVGWFYIVFRRPFDPGNRIQVGEYTGDVIDIRLMEFSMMEVKTRAEGGMSTGRVLHLPNSILLTTTTANASKGFSFNWNEVKIHLTADSDWKKAADLVQQIAEKTLESIDQEDQRIKRSQQDYSIRYSRLTPMVFVEVGDGAIILTLRHLIEPRQTRVITDKLWRAILAAFTRQKRIKLK